MGRLLACPGFNVDYSPTGGANDPDTHWSECDAVRGMGGFQRSGPGLYKIELFWKVCNEQIVSQPWSHSINVPVCSGTIDDVCLFVHFTYIPAFTCICVWAKAFKLKKLEILILLWSSHISGADGRPRPS